MRPALLGVLSGLLASSALAQVRAVLPNCCTTRDVWLSAVNPATGEFERSWNVASAPPSFSGGTNHFALLKGGAGAAVLNQVRLSDYDFADVLTISNLETGKITASLTLQKYMLPGYASTPLAVNPGSGWIYYGYAIGTGSTTLTIEAIDPSTLTVVASSMVTAYASLMTVSQDGTRLYLSAPTGIIVLNAATFQLIGTISLSDFLAFVPSPDGSTLYVLGVGSMYFVDTETFQVTQTIALPSTYVSGPLVVSSDGSQLYFPSSGGAASLALYVLDVSTQLSTTVPVSLQISAAAAAPSGSVYLLGLTTGLTGPTQVAVYDPTSQSITRSFSVVGSVGALALSADGNKLYYLGGESPVLVTGPVPSPTVEAAGPAGGLFSLFSGVGGAYDARDNLVLLATTNGVNILDGDTLRFKASLNIPGESGVLFGNTGYAVIGSECDLGIVQFDPVTLATSGSVQCGNLLWPYNLSQPVLHGQFIYAPFYVTNGDYVTPGTAVFDTEQMKLVATWSTEYTGLAVSPKGKVGYSVVYSLLDVASLVSVDLANGQTVQSLVLGNGYTSNPVLSPDGSTIYVDFNGTLDVVSSQTLTIANSVPGLNLSNIGITPDGAFVYGSRYCSRCTPPNSIAIFSTSTLQVVGSIPMDSNVLPTRPIFIGK